MIKKIMSDYCTCIQRIRSNKIVSAASSSPAALVFLTTLIIGFLTHGYAFFHASLTFDSLNAIYADAVEQAWKVSLGRIFIPAYQTLTRGFYTIPWLIGCLSLLWLGLSFFLTVRMFNIQSPICIILTGGILISNLSVSVTAASFIHDLDINMLGLLMAVLAAYHWSRKPHSINLVSVLCIAVSLGLYQSYVSVCIFLMVLQCIMDLFREKKLSEVIHDGFFACITLLLGAVLYVTMLWVTYNFSDFQINTSTGNGLQNISSLNINSLFQQICKSYSNFHTDLFNCWRTSFSRTFFRIAHVLLALCTAGNAINLLIHMKKNARKGIILAALLLLLIPPIVYFSVILSGGKSNHHLMLYAMWLVYLLILLLVYLESEKNCCVFTNCLRIITAGILIIFIWGNIRTANSLYLAKDMQSESASSLMTRVLYRMESSEEYVSGETPVAIIGDSPLLYPQFPSGNPNYISALFGATIALSDRNPSYAYDPIFKLIKYRLSNPIAVCDNDTYLKLAVSDEILNMPDYPHKDCMKMVDGVFVVKLGHPWSLLSHLGK